MVRIEDSIEIDAPIEVVFNAERNISLHVSTQKARSERAVAGVTSGLINLGEEVEWEARHFGIKQRLRVRITHMSSPSYFRDEMIQGAFKTMSHEHFFVQIAPGKTKKRDVFCFSAPFGVLGIIAEKLFLRPYMTQFLVSKNQAFKRLVENGESSVASRAS